MNVVGYLRLSTRDQSKSLEYQENIIRNYCENNGLNILEIFSDNGQDSYTFDRPDYLALEEFIRTHKGECQYLVVLDHDRFSRNLPEALIKIAELEKKYGVVVISTNERIGMNTADPDVFMKRAFDYLMANHELLNIRTRVRQGILNAKEHGRYLGKAPYGYRNVKSEKENYIKIDHAQAKVVRKIFRDYLLNIPLPAIHTNARDIGFHNHGKNAIYNVLKNCTYAGLVKIPLQRDTPERYVKAIHAEIISEEDFWNVQQKLSKKQPRKSRLAADFPLRGVLNCHCGRHLTAAWSKGRSNYYLYYKCSGHHNLNISGDIIHRKFEAILKNIHFLPHQVHLINQLAKPLLKASRIAEQRIDMERSRKRRLIERKILQLEEKFIDNLIEKPVYDRWNLKLRSELSELEDKLWESKRRKNSLQLEINSLLSDKSSLYRIYSSCNTEQKQVLVHCLFRDKLTWGEEGFSSSFFDASFNHDLKQLLRMKLFSMTRKQSIDI